MDASEWQSFSRVQLFETPPGLQPTRLVHRNRKKKKKMVWILPLKKHVGARINFSFDSDWFSLLSPVLNTRFAMHKVVNLLNEWINSEWMIVNLSMLEQWKNNEWKKAMKGSLFQTSRLSEEIKPLYFLVVKRRKEICLTISPNLVRWQKEIGNSSFVYQKVLKS